MTRRKYFTLHYNIHFITKKRLLFSKVYLGEMITRIYATIYCFGKNKSVDEDIVKWGGWIRNHQAKQWWWCDDVVALHCDKTKRTRIIVNRQVISITSFQKHYHSSLPQNSTCFLLVMMRWSICVRFCCDVIEVHCQDMTITFCAGWVDVEAESERRWDNEGIIYTLCGVVQGDKRNGSLVFWWIYCFYMVSCTN